MGKNCHLRDIKIDMFLFQWIRATQKKNNNLLISFFLIFSEKLSMNFHEKVKQYESGKHQKEQKL